MSCSKISILPSFTNSENNCISFVFTDVDIINNEHTVYWKYKKCDFVKFNEYLNSLNWYDFFNEVDNIDDMWNTLINLLKQSRYFFVPSCNVLAMNRLKKIRYPAYIRKLKLLKKNVWPKRKENGVMVKYLKCNTRCRKAIRGYHRREESSLLNLNARKFYKFLSNNLSSRKSIPVMHDDEGKLFITDNEKVSKFLSESMSALPMSARLIITRLKRSSERSDDFSRCASSVRAQSMLGALKSPISVTLRYCASMLSRHSQSWRVSSAEQARGR